MSRKVAFRAPHDPAWTPAVGENVYLPSRTPFLNSMLAKVRLYDPEQRTVQVTYSVNRHNKTIWLKIEDVRRTPPRFNRKPAQ